MKVDPMLRLVPLTSVRVEVGFHGIEIITLSIPTAAISIWHL